MNQVRIDYAAASGLEPHHPSLGLGLWSIELGEANISEVTGALTTACVDSPASFKYDPEVHSRMKWKQFTAGRYYRRRFSLEEFNDKTDLRIEVTVKVTSSAASPAATCVQFTTHDGRTFGLGFLRSQQLEGDGASDEDAVFLYSDNHEPVPRCGDPKSLDWLRRRAVLGSYAIPVNVTRTYILELLARGPNAVDHVVQLSVEGSDRPPLTARLADFESRLAVPGLLFGHPLKQSVGSAQWQRLTVVTTGRLREPDLPRTIGSRRQLFLDDWIIDRRENLDREMGMPEKYAGNPVLLRDKPWDASRCDLYGSVVWDATEKRLQLFYSAMSKPDLHDDHLAYAESFDGGRSWVKPDLGLFPFGEQKGTNIVWPPRCRSLTGPCVFRDEHDSDPSRRYKLFTADYGGDYDRREELARMGIYVAFSPDGIHWEPSPHNPVLPYLSDTAQCAYWDEGMEKYVAYLRAEVPGHERCIARAESHDFEHWTLPEPCFKPPRFQFYTPGAVLYQGIHIALPWIYWDADPRALEDPDAHSPVISPGLAVSRDGWNWKQLFVGEAFLPTGPRGAVDERQVRLASTLAILPGVDDHIVLMYGASRDPHARSMKVDICQATLRLDGFVALTARKEPGRLVTKPFLLDEGSHLYLNATCDEGGAITAALLDEDGNALPGYEHTRCVEIRGDGLKLPVRWQGEPSQNPRGRAVRLELVMRNARLYSFWQH